MLTRNGDPLKNIEFAFECCSLDGSDTWMKRYVSFQDSQALRAELTERSKTCKILKLHIGACWNGVPRKVVKVDDATTHDLDRLRPVRAPLRIDIDLTDYTHLSVDKHDLDSNDLHFPILDIAMRVTKRALKDCFCMDEIACFYSGRRGCHIWVLDERAWQMDDEARATVIEFLSCPLDRRGVAREGFLDRTPWYTDLYDQEIRPSFVDMLANSEMDLFNTPAAICRFEEMMHITHPEIVRVFRDCKIDVAMSPSDKFQKLHDAVEKLATNVKHEWICNRLKAAILTLLWPRFDKGASTKMNHLIKAPFSVHSNTRRVEVPLGDNLTNFWPGDVPTIGCEAHKIQNAEGLLRDTLTALGAPKPWTDPAEEWSNNLTPGIDPVLQDINRCEEEERRAKRRKLGIDDGIASLDYVLKSNKWGIRTSRAVDVRVSATHLHMRTQLCKLQCGKGKPIKLAVGKEFTWSYSTPVKQVWNAIEPVLRTATETWTPILEDDMLLLFAADDNFSVETKKRAKERMDAIFKRSQDDTLPGHVSVRLHHSKYLTWRHAFPELVRLWPVPGVVEIS